jgi:hypothetical protein
MPLNTFKPLDVPSWKYVLARKLSGKQLFRETEEWFLDKENEALSRPHTEGLDALEGSQAQAEFR